MIGNLILGSLILFGLRKRFSLRALISRERMLACSLYGAIYMAIYLWLGQIIYLILALGLLFIAGLSNRQPR